MAPKSPWSNQLLRRYVHGPRVDEPIVWYEGSGTANRRWLHADERGSIVAISDASGAALAINRYDEYGEPGTANVGRFQYTGQAYIPEAKLYYYKARFYSASLGRFMQTDPIGYAAGMNLYAYVGGNPINLTDPFGLDWFRQDWQTPGVVGRPGTLVEPGGTVSEFIETKVPAGYTFGEMHDSFVGAATAAGWPDSLVNFPSMLFVYGAAVVEEIYNSAVEAAAKVAEWLWPHPTNCN